MLILWLRAGDGLFAKCSRQVLRRALLWYLHVSFQCLIAYLLVLVMKNGLVCLFVCFRAIVTAYGSSQARGRIGAVAAHGNAR